MDFAPDIELTSEDVKLSPDKENPEDIKAQQVVISDSSGFQGPEIEVEEEEESEEEYEEEEGEYE